jgi:NTP pyrophosphatase (non-canonical NTP hydrolase)
MSDWGDRIVEWAMARNLVGGSTPIDQMRKLREEVNELADALDSGTTEEVVDAIGDIQVVLGVMCAQMGLDIDACREVAWDEIKDRKGKMVDGVFVKEDVAKQDVAKQD